MRRKPRAPHTSHDNAPRKLRATNLRTNRDNGRRKLRATNLRTNHDSARRKLRATNLRTQRVRESRKLLRPLATQPSTDQPSDEGVGVGASRPWMRPSPKADRNLDAARTNVIISRA